MAKILAQVSETELLIADTYASDDGRLMLPNGNYVGNDAEKTLADFGINLKELIEDSEIVRLERELDEAKAADVIKRWRVGSYQCNKFQYDYQQPDQTIGDDWRTLPGYSKSRVKATRAAAEEVRKLCAEKEAAAAAQPQQEPAQTICAECKHCKPSALFSMLAPNCFHNAPRDGITGFHLGTACATKRGNNPTEPCPDYEAKE